MSVKFEFYKTLIGAKKEEREQYHARVVSLQTVETEKIIKCIHQSCSLTEGDLLGAFRALSKEIANRLANGERVHIEGLGYFQVTLKCSETFDPKETHAQNVKFKSVKFRADTALKDQLVSLHTERADRRNHSSVLSAEKIDEKLTGHFQANQVLTRSVFQKLCGMTTVTANRQIKQLVEENRLQNINTRYQPIYVPVEGNYGK